MQDILQAQMRELVRHARLIDEREGGMRKGKSYEKQAVKEQGQILNNNTDDESGSNSEGRGGRRDSPRSLSSEMRSSQKKSKHEQGVCSAGNLNPQPSFNPLKHLIANRPVLQFVRDLWAEFRAHTNEMAESLVEQEKGSSSDEEEEDALLQNLNKLSRGQTSSGSNNKKSTTSQLQLTNDLSNESAEKKKKAMKRHRRLGRGSATGGTKPVDQRELNTLLLLDSQFLPGEAGFGSVTFAQCWRSNTKERLRGRNRASSKKIKNGVWETHSSSDEGEEMDKDEIHDDRSAAATPGGEGQHLRAITDTINQSVSQEDIIPGLTESRGDRAKKNHREPHKQSDKNSRSVRFVDHDSEPEEDSQEENYLLSEDDEQDQNEEHSTFHDRSWQESVQKTFFGIDMRRKGNRPPTEADAIVPSGRKSKSARRSSRKGSKKATTRTAEVAAAIEDDTDNIPPGGNNPASSTSKVPARSRTAAGATGSRGALKNKHVTSSYFPDTENLPVFIHWFWCADLAIFVLASVLANRPIVTVDLYEWIRRGYLPFFNLIDFLEYETKCKADLYYDDTTRSSSTGMEETNGGPGGAFDPFAFADAGGLATPRKRNHPGSKQARRLDFVRIHHILASSVGKKVGHQPEGGPGEHQNRLVESHASFFDIPRLPGQKTVENMVLRFGTLLCMRRALRFSAQLKRLDSVTAYPVMHAIQRLSMELKLAVVRQIDSEQEQSRKHKEQLEINESKNHTLSRKDGALSNVQNRRFLFPDTDKIPQIAARLCSVWVEQAQQKLLQKPAASGLGAETFAVVAEGGTSATGGGSTALVPYVGGNEKEEANLVASSNKVAVRQQSKLVLYDPQNRSTYEENAEEEDAIPLLAEKLPIPLASSFSRKRKDHINQQDQRPNGCNNSLLQKLNSGTARDAEADSSSAGNSCAHDTAFNASNIFTLRQLTSAQATAVAEEEEGRKTIEQELQLDPRDQNQTLLSQRIDNSSSSNRERILIQPSQIVQLPFLSENHPGPQWAAAFLVLAVKLAVDVKKTESVSSEISEVQHQGDEATPGKKGTSTSAKHNRSNRITSNRLQKEKPEQNTSPPFSLLPLTTAILPSAAHLRWQQADHKTRSRSAHAWRSAVMHTCRERTDGDTWRAPVYWNELVLSRGESVYKASRIRGIADSRISDALEILANSGRMDYGRWSRCTDLEKNQFCDYFLQQWCGGSAGEIASRAGDDPLQQPATVDLDALYGWRKPLFQLGQRILGLEQLRKEAAARTELHEGPRAAEQDDELPAGNVKNRFSEDSEELSNHTNDVKTSRRGVSLPTVAGRKAAPSQLSSSASFFLLHAYEDGERDGRNFSRFPNPDALMISQEKKQPDDFSDDSDHEMKLEGNFYSEDEGLLEGRVFTSNIKETSESRKLSRAYRMNHFTAFQQLPPLFVHLITELARLCGCTEHGLYQCILKVEEWFLMEFGQEEVEVNASHASRLPPLQPGRASKHGSAASKGQSTGTTIPVVEDRPGPADLENVGDMVDALPTALFAAPPPEHQLPSGAGRQGKRSKKSKGVMKKAMKRQQNHVKMAREQIKIGDSGGDRGAVINDVAGKMNKMTKSKAATRKNQKATND
ncbi:unnamed protein product [Amoebophrya sp. A120]|nr:unnamed protein product [Amoebophrya sp. A120]|eukprot:GSA120T00006071001.1